MKNLQNLIEEYKNNPCVNTQQEIEKFYIKNKLTRQDNQKELLNFFKSDNLEGGIGWENFFDGDKNFWKQVYLISEEKNAIKFLEHVIKYKEKTGETYLSLAVDMCETCASRTQDIKGMPLEIEKVWFEVFKDFPQFEGELTQAKKEKEERLQKYLENLNLPKVETPQTSKVLEIIVPIMSISGKQIDFKEIESTDEYQEFMKDRVEFFNNFHLQGYINYPQCHSITMRVENNQNIFTLKINNEGDLNILKQELLGQLTDGLGSNLAQKGLIIGEKEYTFDFDVKNASDFIELKEQKKLKIK